MNRTETVIVVLLFLALLAWFHFYAPSDRPAPAAQRREPKAAHETTTNAVATFRADAADDPGQQPESDASLTERLAQVSHSEPETIVVLSNDVIEAAVTSWGAAIRNVKLKQYRRTVEEDSGPLIFDFHQSPALAFEAPGEFSTNADFHVAGSPSSNRVTFAKVSADGLVLLRTITLASGYRFIVTDVFTNASEKPILLPSRCLSLGPIKATPVRRNAAPRYEHLGVNSLASHGGEEVVFWHVAGPPEDKRPLAERFLPQRYGGGCRMFRPTLPAPLPRAIPVRRKQNTAWVALTDRFFAETLWIKDGADELEIRARRHVPESENPDDSRTWSAKVNLEELSAAMRLAERILQPGAAAIAEMQFYLGPKKYSLLKQLGARQDRILFRTWAGWGWFRSVCIGMLHGLNGLYAVFPNYGVAITLLTAAVWLVFRPITNKSAESMEKMRQLAPMLEELAKKYKDAPERLRKEQAALYKKHKINPMAGCLPVIIQMPVFIAFFNVLRGGVELRFARFLWIRDLSEPEELLRGMLPPPFHNLSLNLLPLLMTAASFWQQKLTPAGGDPQQQKMMAWFMPLFMLFILYNMPSGLALYWTVAQVLAIAQQLLRRKAAAVSA